jgi:FAD synthetase
MRKIRKKVLVFGSFDPLHMGHLSMFKQARHYGEWLIVVVARDTTIQEKKGHQAYVQEDERVARVRATGVNEVILGDKNPDRYELLKTLDFDVLALGYDQAPELMKVQAILDDMGKTGVRVVRLNAFKPDKYKSSLIRSGNTTRDNKYGVAQESLEAIG